MAHQVWAVLPRCEGGWAWKRKFCLVTTEHEHLVLGTGRHPQAAHCLTPFDSSVWVSLCYLFIRFHEICLLKPDFPWKGCRVAYSLQLSPTNKGSEVPWKRRPSWESHSCLNFLWERGHRYPAMIMISSFFSVSPRVLCTTGSKLRKEGHFLSLGSAMPGRRVAEQICRVCDEGGPEPSLFM